MKYESQRRAKKLYKIRHREKVNTQRRKRYLERRIEALGNKQCSLCTRLISDKPRRSIKYCENCREYPLDVRAMEPKNLANKLRQRPWMSLQVLSKMGV